MSTDTYKLKKTIGHQADQIMALQKEVEEIKREQYRLGVSVGRLIELVGGPVNISGGIK